MLEISLAKALAATLPPVPPMPQTAGAVVAVVGSGDHIMATAQALASEIGAPPGEVAIAVRNNGAAHVRRDRGATTVISSAQDASEQRRGWRWRGRPSVVAIETDGRPSGDPWAASVLKALEPTVCWGVVEAFCKPEDVAAWSEALGGLDVLSVVDLDATTTPAAVLATRLPVGLVDGEPATPEFWASSLCARLPR